MSKLWWAVLPSLVGVCLFVALVYLVTFIIKRFVEHK
jgi:hypothetical protein